MADYALTTLPTVGGSNDAWGTLLNNALNAIDDGLDGTTQISPDLKVGGFELDGVAVTVTAAEVNKLDGVSGDVITTATSRNLVAGHTTTTYDAGTKSTGDWTPDPANGQFQKIVNNGAFVLRQPASDTSMVIKITNGASAGAITFDYDIQPAGSLTTTNGDVALIGIVVVDGTSMVNILGRV